MMRMAFIWEMILRGCRACCKVTVVAKGAGQDISYQYFGPSTLGAGEGQGKRQIGRCCRDHRGLQLGLPEDHIDNVVGVKGTLLLHCHGLGIVC